MKSKSIVIVLLVACFLASCVPTNKVTPAETAISTAPFMPTLPVTFTTISPDSIAGDWTGVFQGINDDFSAEILVSINENCETNNVCGTYSTPYLPCSGNLTLTRTDNTTFVFVEQKTGGADWCGSGGLEYLELLPDNTLSWGYSDPGGSIKSKGTLTKLESTAGKNWETQSSLLLDSPFVYKADKEFWHEEIIPGSSIAFNADTRWAFDIEVDGTSKDSTGILFHGYATNGDVQVLGLFYSSGSWHLGYGPRNNEYSYWWDFENLTSPKQSFVLSVSRDGNRISIKNNEGFSHDIEYQVKLFEGAELITAGFLSSPKVNISLSNLVVEQFQPPGALTASAVSLSTPYTQSFEDLAIANPTEVSPFRFPKILELALFQGRESWVINWAKDEKFTPWVVDSKANTGKYAINVVPNGNPQTQSILPVSIAVLDPVFNVSGYDTVNLKMWINTTSNPRIASVHNCDSSLNIFFKTDLGAWTHKTAMCGENEKESQGWHEISLDFDVKGKSVIQFAFTYEVQNISKPDPTIYYLIDDVEITAK